jgi:hypothetical protein
MSDCLSTIVAGIEESRALSKAERERIAQIHDDLNAQVDKVRSSSMTDRKASIDALKEMIVENATNLKNYRITHLNNVTKIETIKLKLETLGWENPDKIEKAMVDFIDGDNSIDTAQRVLGNQTTALLQNELIKSGVLEDIKTGQFDDAIMIASYDKARGKITTIDDHTVSSAVDAIQLSNDFLWHRTVDAGVSIGYVDGYVLKQGNYDLAKLNGNKELFVDEMSKAIDLSETFSKTQAEKLAQDPTALHEILGTIFDEMITPNIKGFGEDADVKSYKNRLKSRVFVFKDGESNLKIDKLFGKDGSLLERLEMQNESTSTFVANAQYLGTEPALTMTRVMEHVANNIKDKEAFNRIDASVRKAYVNTVAPPHSPTTLLNKTVNTMRAMSSFTKLGSAAITAAYDVIPASLQYAVHSGEGIIKSFGVAVKTFAELVGTQGADDVSEKLGIVMHLDPLVSMGLSSAKSKNFFNQKTNKFLSGFSKFTGVPLQTKYSRATSALMHARNFTSSLDNGVSDYTLKHVYERYGMTPQDIAILRSLPREKVAGTEIVTPDSIMAHADMRPADRQELFFKYANYLDDIVHKGTPTPTARTKRQMLRGYDQSSTVRDIMGLVMQFKETAWKLAYENGRALQDIHAVGGKGAVAMSSVELAVVSAITYMGIEEARALLFNKPSPFERLKDKQYADTAFDFINKAAFAPIMGDIIESGVMGKPGAVADYILGPNYSVAKDAGNLLLKTGKAITSDDPDKKSKAIKEAGKFIKRNMLPSNWIPVKAADGWTTHSDFVTGRRYNK